MSMKKVLRRRGEALESAILEAAWAELLHHGYAKFTMDSVAKRAGTNRSVLSRRWPDRAEFAVAAINYYLHKTQISIPDMGNVRDELALLMSNISEHRMDAVTIVLGMRDYFVETSTSMADLRNQFATNQTIDEILLRAVRRGEIDPHKLTKRIGSLPLDLLRHEVFMTQQPVSDVIIHEILDTIFLPLVMLQSPPRAPRG